jgi:protein-S-isoprenylcysteine O-methyltransferase Ste14
VAGEATLSAEARVQRYVAALTIVLLIGMVLARALWMRGQGVGAFHFGRTHKTDYLIPPFAFFYFYLVFAAAFDWPAVSRQRFFDSEVLSWLGVLLCLAGTSLFLLSLISFGRSFRVGIDTERPGGLVTTGVFAWSRNPMYVAFALVLLGQCLVSPNWVMLAYLVAGVWLLHRQVLREEEYLRWSYGGEYDSYCKRVRRYF